MVSEVGYYLDGIGDKAFTVAIILVFARQNPVLLPIAWLLISREIFLYALRVLDNNRIQNLKKLRRFSLLQALFIRLLFLGFFVEECLELYSIETTIWFQFYLVTGCLSIMFGYVSVVQLANQLIKKETAR